MPVVVGDRRCLRGGAAVAADALRGGTRRASGTAVVHRLQRHHRRLPDRLRAVRGGVRERLLQRLLLVSRRLHPLPAVLGARPSQYCPQLRNADGETSSPAAAETQPPSGVSATAGALSARSLPPPPPPPPSSLSSPSVIGHNSLRS